MKEIIDIVIYILATLACILCYNYCYSKINNYKLIINRKNFMILVLVATIVALDNIFNPLIIKVIINLAVITLELKIIFKDNIKKSIISYILIFLCLVLIEIIITNVLSLSGILTSNSSAITFSYMNEILSIVVGIFECLLLSIKFINQSFNKLTSIFVRNINAISIAYLIFIAIAILGTINVKNFASDGSIQLILILFIIYVILFVLIIHSKSKEELLKVSNKKLIDYNDKYGKFLDEYKIYKHNINHKLSAMKTFGNKKINALIDELLEEETNFSIKNNNLYNVPNGIKGVVAEKLYNTEYNVIINNRIKGDPFIKLSPKAFNSISECIGIILDNAIEAVSETKEPIIIMDLYEDETSLYIRLGNNYINDIDLEQLGNKYYSTKNRGSGLGLFSIIRNNLVKEKIDIINNFYYIELQIKKHA